MHKLVSFSSLQGVDAFVEKHIKLFRLSGNYSENFPDWLPLVEKFKSFSDDIQLLLLKQFANKLEEGNDNASFREFCKYFSDNSKLVDYKYNIDNSGLKTLSFDNQRLNNYL